MKTYGQFCPVAQALEILAERWTLLVIRELLMGSQRFSDIRRGVPQMSKTLLSQRLKTLLDSHVIEHKSGPVGSYYELTEAGEALRPIVMQVGWWGKRHAQFGLEQQHLDPDLLMWDVQRRLINERLPKQRVCVLFKLLDQHSGQRRYWLALGGQEEPDLCLKDPGIAVNLTLESDTRTLTEVWTGERRFSDCIQEQSITLKGESKLARALPKWLALSVFAGAPEQ